MVADPLQSRSAAQSTVENHRAGAVKLRRLLIALFAGASCLPIAVIFTYKTVPTSNTEESHRDAIVVLGSPPDPDGRPSSEQRARVHEAVREFNAGRASHIILSGGAAHSRKAEAVVMAEVAKEEGVPPEAITLETLSTNTIENVYFSALAMREHGWMSVEVISSPSHLPRAALILEHYDLCWNVHPSRWPREYSWMRIGRYYLRETLGTSWFRWFGFRKSAYLPASEGGCMSHGKL